MGCAHPSPGHEFRLPASLGALRRIPRRLLSRLERRADKGELDEERAVAAALGGEEQPALMFSGLFEEHEEISRAGHKAMSPDHVRMWRNPEKRAVENLITVLSGDRPVTKVTRNVALDFRAWWQDWILHEDVQIETANKDIGHINPKHLSACCQRRSPDSDRKNILPVRLSDEADLRPASGNLTKVKEMHSGWAYLRGHVRASSRAVARRPSVRRAGSFRLASGMSRGLAGESTM